MFKFEPVERCLYSGVSQAVIGNSMRNEFLMLFGDECINYKVSVILTERNIQFFYYDDKQPVNLQDARNIDKLKEVGSISLTNPKETGNDILEFPQNKRIIGELNEVHTENIKKIIGKDTKIIGKDTLSGYSKLFYNFPFLRCRERNVKGSQQEQSQEELFCRFLRCCLLAFIFEFEDRNENFANSPLYDIVRDSLRRSSVYKLLAAKIQYTLYVPQEGMCYNQEEYTYKAQKFADRLMDGNINKVIDPNYYEEEIWFDNPEKEIEELLKKNRQQVKAKRGITLKKSLVSKIRSFLYSKHATYKAMTNCPSKWLFIIAQILMLVFNGMLAFALIFCNNNSFGLGFLQNIILIGGGAALVVFILLVVACCRNGSSNAFFPRILVAELAAWLTIGIAEDLVKSMLLVEKKWILGAAIFLVSLLILIILIGEIRQHSPYITCCQKWERALTIFNHSLFFAFIFGIVMQFIFYNNLVKNSDVISTVVYNDYFDDASHYRQSLEELDVSLRQFEILNNTTAAIGNILLDGGLRGTSQIKDTAGNLIGVLTSNARMSMKGKENDTIGDYNKEVEMVNNSIKEILKLDTALNIIDTAHTLYKVKPFLDKGSISSNNDSTFDDYCLDTLVNNATKASAIIESNRAIIESNRNRANENMVKLREEIRNVRRGILSYNNFNNLMAWAEISDSITQSVSNSAYLDSLTNITKQSKRCWVRVCEKNEQIRLFPYLLIFHTLIVLVLAFVTQLIISDKSVTEPL